MNIRTLATGLLLAFGASAPAIADTIQCESSDGRESFCRGNTYGGVVLSTQLSSNGCYQGDTWGYNRDGVWVSGGCRAVFQTGGYAGNNYHSGNDYYSGDRGNRGNDGAVAALAIGAIIGAAAIASSGNRNRGHDYYYNNGCNAGRGDRRGNQTMFYGRHGGSYDGGGEQSFASGYNRCWSGR